MSVDKHDLGRRAVACPGFRWMRGMWSPPRPDHPDDIGILVLYNMSGDRLLVIDEDGDVGVIDATGRYPDLNDPATRGCFLELVRKAWCTVMGRAVVDLTDEAEDGLWCVEVMRWWDDEGIYEPDFSREFAAPTEAEVLVLALEEAGR